MFKKFRVKIDGETFEVSVEEIEDKPIRVENIREVKESAPVTSEPADVKVVQPPKPAKTVEKPQEKEEVAEPKSAKIVAAPLPGKVLKVNVASGSKVKRGDVLMTIEAMKMENEILASMNGTVKSVFVETGKNVETKEKLLEFE
jgi:biotin carboxyl carrier protein